MAVINDHLNRQQHGTASVTDADGMIDFLLTSEGLNVVDMEHAEAVSGPDVDERFMFSTLSFVLPHVE